MSKAVTAVSRFVRKWWWLFVAAGGLVLGVLWKIVSAGAKPQAEAPAPTKTMASQALEKVERVHLEGEVEKAKTRAVADEHLQQIAAIEDKGKTNPVEARQDLADFLAKNL